MFQTDASIAPGQISPTYSNLGERIANFLAVITIGYHAVEASHC